MSIKFSISTVAMAVVLTLTHAAIATAEVYKTSKGQVVVTGLTAKQQYPIQVVSAKNKTRTLKSKIANGCGEVKVDNANSYKSLVVGTETIDPTTLPIKVHANCKPKKTAVAPKKKTTTTDATTMPATMTPGTK